MCLDFMEFDAFQGLAQELAAVELKDTGTLLNLFREWEIVEAKEMMRVTKGRNHYHRKATRAHRNQMR